MKKDSSLGGNGISLSLDRGKGDIPLAERGKTALSL